MPIRKAPDRKTQFGPLVEVLTERIRHLQESKGKSNRDILRGVTYSEMALSKLLRGAEGVKRCRLNVLEGIAANLGVLVSHLMVDPEAHGVPDPVARAGLLHIPESDDGGWVVRAPAPHLARKTPRLGTHQQNRKAREDVEGWHALESEFYFAMMDLALWRVLLPVARGNFSEPTAADRRRFAGSMREALEVLMRPLGDRAVTPDYTSIRRAVEAFRKAAMRHQKTGGAMTHPYTSIPPAA